MDSSFVMDSIRSATSEVFSMMLGMELTPGDPRTSSSAPVPHGGIQSFIGLTGSWVGTGSIACSPAFACQAAGALLLTEYCAVNEEVLDAIAEMTNMIIGNVKTALEAVLGPMGLSIPTVIFGRNFVSRTSVSTEWMIVPFHIADEVVEIQLCLTPCGDSDQMARSGHAPQSRATTLTI